MSVKSNYNFRGPAKLITLTAFFSFIFFQHMHVMGEISLKLKRTRVKNGEIIKNESHDRKQFYTF